MMNRRIPSMNVLKLSCILCAALTGIGCIASPDSADEDASVEEAAQPFSSYSGIITRNKQSATDSGHRVLLGASGTCFLSGTFGNLRPGTTAAGTTVALGSSGLFLDSNGDWILASHDSTGTEKVGSQVVCLPSVTNEIFPVRWSTGMPFKQLGPTGHNRVCGLTEVDNAGDNGTVTHRFSSAADQVGVFVKDGFWWIGGSGNAAGAAACVDASNDFTVSRTWAGGSSSSSVLMTQLPDQGTNPLGTQCFLTGVEGAFTTNSYSNGVGVSFDSTSTTWSLDVSAGKAATALCIQ